MHLKTLNYTGNPIMDPFSYIYDHQSDYIKRNGYCENIEDILSPKFEIISIDPDILYESSVDDFDSYEDSTDCDILENAQCQNYFNKNNNLDFHLENRHKNQFYNNATDCSKLNYTEICGQTTRDLDIIKTNCDTLQNRFFDITKESDIKEKCDNRMKKQNVLIVDNIKNEIVPSLNNKNDTSNQCNAKPKMKRRLNIQEYLSRRKQNSGINNQINESPPLRIETNQTDIDKSTNENVQCNPNSNSNYVEKIIVSIGCNTNITISPDFFSEHSNTNKLNDKINQSTNLTNNVNMNKIEMSNETVKISSNSLIASIQEVILNKSNTLNIEEQITTKGNQSNGNNECKEHGEDKIIMHLRKDRPPVKSNSIACQTDFTLHFSILKIPVLNNVEIDTSANIEIDDTMINKSLRRDKRKRKLFEEQYPCRYKNKSLPTSHSGSYSSENDMSSPELKSDKVFGKCNESNKRKYNGNVRYRQKSIDSYRNELHSMSDSDSSYSSKYDVSPVKKPRQSIETTKTERCIVYVGRLEPSVTKDRLKQKFIRYGPIKQVTLHHKDTGLKYGFVTFEKADDAYNAIGRSTCDPVINMYDVSFGGRRAFCGSSYMDLDGYSAHDNKFAVKPSSNQSYEDSFEDLLKKVKDKLLHKKSVQS